MEVQLNLFIKNILFDIIIRVIIRMLSQFGVRVMNFGIKV